MAYVKTLVSKTFRVLLKILHLLKQLITPVGGKAYNRCILNRIRPVVDKILRPNQNGFRQKCSTSAHILALQRILEELKNHRKEDIISFIDFRKAFDSIR